jgi:hypothetical protein
MTDQLDWPFDQAPNIAALTSRLVTERGHPIRQVHHYEDDHSWSFLGGTKEEQDALILVHMGHMLNLDETLRLIADLEPGWSAWRDEKGDGWERYLEEETD